MANRVLIVVDVQKDFLPGGALAVPRGNEIIPVLHKIIPAFKNVVFTMDSHPKNHKSFASQNPGFKPFEAGPPKKVSGHAQMMWPDHCVIDTEGWLLEPTLRACAFRAKANIEVVMKGMNPDFDSYSGFMDDGGNGTDLCRILEKWNVVNVFVCGLATDYCVKATALDSYSYGYLATTTVIVDACRGLNAVEDAYIEMARKGIQLVHSEYLLK